MTSREPRNSKAGKMTAKASGGGQGAVKLGPEIRARIGRQLRAMYDEVVSQGVPDRFADLLKDLDVPNPEGDK